MIAVHPTSTRILESAKVCLLRDGYAALSTRRVADEARVPLSQIHYHFGSKQELILGLLERENERLLARQTEMYARDLPLSERWDIACNFLEDDLASGYVRVLQEMIAAGWADTAIAVEIRRMLSGWSSLLARVAREAKLPGPFSAAEIAALVEAVFLGAESMILLGREQQRVPVRRALRKVGAVLRALEPRPS